MKGTGTGGRAARKPIVVVAGEDSNDRKCLRILLEAFCPDMHGRVVEINDSVRLRQASDQNLKARVQALAKKVDARAAREDADVACVFVHEDLDAVDSSDYPTTRKRVQEALDGRLWTSHYVLAAWELEAWLMLFPDALSAHVPSWNLPAKYRNKDTGLLTDPKRILQTTCTSKKRRYVESDAPAILRRAVERGEHTSPQGANRSWEQMRAQARECCTLHLPTRRGKRR